MATRVQGRISMKIQIKTVALAAMLLTLNCVAFPAARGDDLSDAKEWIELSAGEAALEQWQEHHGTWQSAGDAALAPRNDKRLAAKPGEGVFLSSGDGSDLLTVEDFQDVELQLEFMVPKGSNSGVKLNGLYEIQIRDTYGQQDLSGDSCGGIYPRAELEPRYHWIDKGVPPLVNASRPAGQWQTLKLRFYSPRFDERGKKTAKARFENVVLNGETVHKSVELDHPTGHAWDTKPEVAAGPLLLQGDHGPVAFRNLKIRRIGSRGPAGR